MKPGLWPAVHPTKILALPPPPFPGRRFWIWAVWCPAAKTPGLFAGSRQSLPEPLGPLPGAIPLYLNWTVLFFFHHAMGRGPLSPNPSFFFPSVFFFVHPPPPKARRPPPWRSNLVFWWPPRKKIGPRPKPRACGFLFPYTRHQLCGPRPTPIPSRPAFAPTGPKKVGGPPPPGFQTRWFFAPPSSRPQRNAGAQTAPRLGQCGPFAPPPFFSPQIRLKIPAQKTGNFWPGALTGWVVPGSRVQPVYVEFPDKTRSPPLSPATIVLSSLSFFFFFKGFFVALFKSTTGPLGALLVFCFFLFFFFFFFFRRGPQNKHTGPPVGKPGFPGPP